jgi:hypothetical protein
MNKRITDFFRRETDGSWTCTETVSVDHSTGGQMHFTKGAVFHAEDVFMGVKVAKWLDSLADARHK